MMELGMMLEFFKDLKDEIRELEQKVYATRLFLLKSGRDEWNRALCEVENNLFFAFKMLQAMIDSMGE